MRGVPFYRLDGGYWLMWPVEVDDSGAPPQVVQFIAPDHRGQVMRCHYRRKPGPGGGCRWPWLYVETRRHTYPDPTIEPAGPAPGSPDALTRLVTSQQWTAHSDR